MITSRFIGKSIALAVACFAFFAFSMVAQSQTITWNGIGGCNITLTFETISTQLITCPGNCAQGGASCPQCTTLRITNSSGCTINGWTVDDLTGPPNNICYSICGPGCQI